MVSHDNWVRRTLKGGAGWAGGWGQKLGEDLATLCFTRVIASHHSVHLLIIRTLIRSFLLRHAQWSEGAVKDSFRVHGMLIIRHPR